MFRKMICLVSLVLVLGLVGDVQAIDWTDGGPDHLWSTPTNWDTGTVPTSSDEVVINLVPGPIIDPNVDAVAGGLKLGYAGQTGELTMDGGTLTLEWSNIGEDDDGYGTVNMNSGTITIDGLTVGDWGSGTINMTGGTIIVGDDFMIAGDSSTATGHVNLDGGTITAGNFVMRVDKKAVGTMDVGAGTLIIDGNVVETVQGYIDNGWITGYDGYGTLNLDYGVTNEGKTTLTATHFLNPIPADGSTVPAALDLLQWTLPEVGPYGGNVTCDVYVGTNPSIWENPKIVNRQAVESVSVTLAGDTTYYWAIVLFDSGSSTPDEPYMWWPIFTFYTVGNFPPVVDANDDIDSWLANGETERVVQLGGVLVEDDGIPGPATFEWTVTAEPNVANPATFDDATLLNATVTVKEVGTYTLQLEADDGESTPDTDTMQIELYADSCEHAQNQGGFEWLAGDVNQDCKVDFRNFASFAATWLDENYSTE